MLKRSPNKEGHYSVFRAYRARYIRRLIKNIIETFGSCRILDVGGRAMFWKSIGILPGGGITIHILNISLDPDDYDSRFTSTVGTGTNMSQFGDKTFDLVVCNSVIAHVPVEERKNMAEEIRRVGHHYFVQTPNKDFIIDWVTWRPNFHKLPLKDRAEILTKRRVWRCARLTKGVDEAIKWLKTKGEPLSLDELQNLLPDSKVIPEEFFGIPILPGCPKSYMLIA